MAMSDNEATVFPCPSFAPMVGTLNTFGVDVGTSVGVGVVGAD